MTLLRDTEAETLNRWRWRPIDFVREVFDAEPDAWQAEALAAFPYYPQLAMKACKGPGKTTVLAWLCWNFLATRPDPKIGATSISEDNLSDNLWAEMAKWQERSPMLAQSFTWTKTLIFLTEAPARCFMSFRTWPRTADPQRQADTLAGLHADYIMFVLDESGSIPQPVMVTAQAVLSSCVEGHVVQSGNPTSLEGPLYRACSVDRHLWKVIEITGDPDDPKRSPRIDRTWAQQQIDSYGRDNPWVMVNVLGQFPPASLNALLGIEDVQAAMQRRLLEPTYSWAQKRIGVDVARFGDDLTVLFPRQGRRAFKPRGMRHGRQDNPSLTIATAVIRGKTGWGSEQEFIDSTGGWAAGARDVLTDGGYPIHEVQFHAPAYDRRYANRRSEMWFAMAKWVKEGGWLPNVPELVGELVTPTYTFRRGQFALEEKEQIKERLGRSPNYADALATTFALPEMPAQIVSQLRGRGKAARDADPYATEAEPWK